jgi:O-antigen/teichoic acid export membrane protein
MDQQTAEASGSTRVEATTRPNHSMMRNASFLLAGQAASAALSLVLTAFLGRWLGVADFGIYYLLMAWSAFAYVVAEWGQCAYLLRETARRHEDSGKLLSGAMAFRILAALVAALATAIFVKLIGYGDRIEFLAPLAIMCGLPLALSQTYGYIFRGHSRMDLDAAVIVAAKAFTATVTIPALILGGSLFAVILLQAVGGLGALLVAIFLARRIQLTARWPEFGTLHELAKGGAPIALFFVVIAVQPFIDALVLAALVPPAVVGWYGAARNIMMLICAPAMILGTASFPELARVSDSTSDLRRILRTSWRLLLGLGTLAGVGTFMFADLAVSIVYGRGDFEPAVAVLQVFAPILPLLFIDVLLGNAIIAVGKTKEMALVKAVAVAMSTGLAFLLIPLFQVHFGNGGIGLAVAFGSTEVLMLVAFLWLLPRGVIDLSGLLDVIRAAAAAVGTLALLWALPSMTAWLTVPVCVGAFIVLTLATGLVRATELTAFANLRHGAQS